MIPSLVASEVATGLCDFLTTQFRPANAALKDILDDFIRDQTNFIKGPYLSVSLPFQKEKAEESAEPFPEIPLGFTPFSHQRKAFDRLAQGRSTIVATGTGSGKTECFMYPILDACRMRSGEPGIKAIFVYPMNALANDQAGRLAKIIHKHDSLRGRVTAGIFVGRGRGKPQTRMTPTSIVSSHETLVEYPPDILITNYKMLDYLLVRPRDQELWRSSGPNSLKWIVVDELHTFDGAQGTDLACLMRRLRARLGVKASDLTCVGTSATLGDGSKQELIDYAAEVFGRQLDWDCVVGEERKQVFEFLGGFASHSLPQAAITGATGCQPAFESTEDYIRAQYELFFGKPPGPSFPTLEWRVALAEQLRRHHVFFSLLVFLEKGPKTVTEVVDSLRNGYPSCSAQQAAEILNGMFALVSFARVQTSASGVASGKPLLEVGLHLWVRELARMVCSVHETTGSDTVQPGEGDPVDVSFAGDEQSVTSDRLAGATSNTMDDQPYVQASSKPHRLRFSDDLGPDERSLHLPLIQCLDCRTTGWVSVVNPDGHLQRELSIIYNEFFSSSPSVKFFFPDRRPTGGRGTEGTLCGRCGHLSQRGNNSNDKICKTCESSSLVQVFIPETVGEPEGDRASRLLTNCPYCLGREQLFIFGVRSASLLSVALDEAYGSHHNDDQKAIAFSDSVQDAAHKAGYLTHRGWRRVKRTAIAQAIPERSGLSLSSLPSSVVDRCKKPADGAPERTRQELVSQFIAPDRRWLRDFVHLVDNGRLPASSRIASLVERRLRWESIAELGYASEGTYSLVRSGTAAAGPDLERLTVASREADRQLREEIHELSGMSSRAVQWLALGVVRRMLSQGAVLTDGVEGLRRYVVSGCSVWNLHDNRALAEFGPSSLKPIYPGEVRSAKSSIGIEPVVRRSSESWYQRWVKKVLSQEAPLLSADHPGAVLKILLECLESQGLVLSRTIGKRNPTLLWGINADRFAVTRQTSILRGRETARALVVPASEGELWVDAPCLNVGVHDSYGPGSAGGQGWASRSYSQKRIHRLVAHEHTALLTDKTRHRVEDRFKAAKPSTTDPNLISATPTLELGIDIGDLSIVALCSVPPVQANFVQRIGRAGRHDGNAFTLTIARARPHDLHFYADPLKMLAGRVTPPGVFLNASAVLERQLTAFCFDNWAAQCGDPGAVPPSIGQVLYSVEKRIQDRFPYTLFDYVRSHAKTLFVDFLRAFEGSLSTESGQHLETFLEGDDREQPRLEVRIMECLEEELGARQSIYKDLQVTRRAIRRLKRLPSDDATMDDINNLERDQQGLRRLLAKINQRDTFGFLTDRGLLPNYEFPETGVMLRSVILRRVKSYEAQQAAGSRPTTDLTAYEYLRPAAAALSEFAPHNHFYAEGFRVMIDRVDLEQSPIEMWRLCPSCPHCASIETGDGHKACPSCGDPMWADTGQVCRMANLRAVQATSRARGAQIMDDRDEREAYSFVRHLVPLLDPTSKRSAFAVNPDAATFGYEYASRTKFLEINFGRKSARGQPTRFAGEELPRVGFRLCRHCGQVQPLGSAKPKHVQGCKATRGVQAWQSDFGHSPSSRPADPNMVDCLYLYRSFDSESLRMLIPSIGISDRIDGRRAQSFIAALELGLREHFRGRIDHLRVTPYERPGADDQIKRRYLVLYDTVPGGTGYLKQLATRDGEFMSVFEKAKRRLEECDCDDGCYRCVFAYRRDRSMAETSKGTAIELLEGILKDASSLEEVDSLDSVTVTSIVDSELELRFLSALEQYADATPSVTVRRELVEGKVGHVLKVHSSTWYVECQASVGPSQGVVEPSKPDFLFRSAKATDSVRPVAVFLDGFQHHKDSSAKDCLQRMALLRAGFLQWSLTWHDLESAFGGQPITVDLFGVPSSRGESGNGMRALRKGLDEKWSTGPTRSALRGSSFDILMRYLAEPDFSLWRRAVLTDSLRIFDQSTMSDSEWTANVRTAMSRLLPAQANEQRDSLPQPVYFATRGQTIGAEIPSVDIFLALSKNAIEPGDPDAAFAAVHLHDEDTDSEDYREHWNSALRSFNLLQFFRDAWWTTTRAVKSGAIPELPSAVDRLDGELTGDWAIAVEDADSTVRQLLIDLYRGGADLPEVGYELMDSQDDEVVAQAELAWPDQKAAVLVVEEQEDLAALRQAGWLSWVMPVQQSVVLEALSALPNIET